MKKILLALLVVLATACTPVFRVTTPLPVTLMSDAALHAAACEAPASAVCGAPVLSAPRVGPIPTPRRFGAGFPASVPLTSLQQGGASSTNVLAWNGSNWAPSVGGGSPTGTGVALVSGGAFVGAAGTVDLSSGTYVANLLGFAHGGTGAALSCTTGDIVQAASGSPPNALACRTMSGDVSISSSGVTNVLSVAAQSGPFQVFNPGVTNFSTGNNGTFTYQLHATTTNTTPDTSMAFGMPGSGGLGGNVTIIVSGLLSGTTTSASAVWSGFVADYNGTCVTMTGGSFTQASSGSFGTVAATPISVALSGCNIVMTVTGTGTNTWNWSSTIQLAVAGP